MSNLFESWDDAKFHTRRDAIGVKCDLELSDTDSIHTNVIRNDINPCYEKCLSFSTLGKERMRITNEGALLIAGAQISSEEGVASKFSETVLIRQVQISSEITGVQPMSGHVRDLPIFRTRYDLHKERKVLVSRTEIELPTTGITFQQPVIAAATNPVSLSGEQIVDGIHLFIGDRVLVKNQANTNENAVYSVRAGVWVPYLDAVGTFVNVNSGQQNHDTSWVMVGHGDWCQMTGPPSSVPIKTTSTPKRILSSR